MQKVSIHLITWNGQKYIEDCLNSILEQTYKDFLLLIIDNGSADHTVKIIEQQFLPIFGTKIRFIKNKENLGFARAHNQALLWTDSEYILALNQDVILDPDYLAQAINFLENHKTSSSVNGKVLRLAVEQDGELKKNEKTDIIDSLGLRLYKNHKVIDRAADEKDQGQYNQITEIFGVNGTCPIYRRQALADIRYQDEFFDNDFVSYKEDIDLAYRLRWRGWQSYYLPTAVAYHARTAKTFTAESTAKLINERKNKHRFINYLSYRNHLFFLIKNLSSKIFWHCFFQISFWEIKKILYLIIFERSTLSGLREVFAKYKVMKIKHKFIMSRRLVKEEEIYKWFN